MGEGFGSILNDLYKTFDCFPHDLFIAKMQGHELDTKELTFSAPIPRNGQTHSNNSLGICRRIV